MYWGRIMIHITLGRMRYVDPKEDQLGREHLKLCADASDEFVKLRLSFVPLHRPQRVGQS